MHEATAKLRILTDQRKQERYRLNRQPDFPLYIRTPLSRSAAMAVKDVSVDGVSIYVEQPLPIAMRVSVEFAASPVQLDVQGVVAWCRPRHQADKDAEYATDAHVLGIELFSPMILLSAFRDALPVYALVLDDL